MDKMEFNSDYLPVLASMEVPDMVVEKVGLGSFSC